MHFIGEISLGQLLIGALLACITIINALFLEKVKEIKSSHEYLNKKFEEHAKDYEIHTFPHARQSA